MQATMHETQVPATRVVPTVPKWVRTGLRHLLMGAIALVMAMPFLAMVLLAVRPEGTTSLSGMFFSTEFTLDHFKANLQNDSMVRWILNSFIYAFVSVVLVLLLCSMAGYAFAKKRFFGRDQIFWTFIAMLVVPGQVTLVPLFILIVQLDGANTYWGLIVPTIANAQGVFLMRQYIKGIPDELIEAAKIDGATSFTTLIRVVMPLSRPIIAVIIVWAFLNSWNEFFLP
ncbi:MAG TPA: carbohydrate ABC transporter permease, partial [Thermomicrobiales bacterium]|nr:carbohydrate ABC transporter permease [Thermomicrobiales bacterium]